VVSLRHVIPILSHPCFSECNTFFSRIDDGETAINAIASNARTQNPTRIKNMSLLIIPKRGPFFWRVIQRIALDLDASISIRHSESKTGEMQSLEELRTWQKQQTEKDLEFGIDVPTEIRFLRDGRLLCLTSLEDWSDIGKPEPYSLSYTFSFYSYEKEIDESINNSIAAQLSQDEEVGGFRTFQECNSPKWYLSYNPHSSSKFLILTTKAVRYVAGAFPSALGTSKNLLKPRQTTQVSLFLFTADLPFFFLKRSKYPVINLFSSFSTKEET